MDRITRKNLEAVVGRINKATGSPMEPWSVGEDGKTHANIGNYHLSYAYGRVSLERMLSSGGSVKRVCGSGTKRELYDQLFAFLAGVEAGREVPNA